jgi:hypothetical protein
MFVSLLRGFGVSPSYPVGTRHEAKGSFAMEIEAKPKTGARLLAGRSRSRSAMSEKAGMAR